MLIVEQLRMIKVRAFDASGGTLGDGTQFFNRGFTAVALKTLMPLT
ncbi:MAG TPA: hypothetical protein VK724_00290 [Bryobacteraceae bacterium]|nr:hypothetical protein [Bryobacteraceae bacterium]